jgi:nitroreductase
MMDFELLLKKRRMVRSFRNKEVGDGLVMYLLRNAQKAPSAGFLQQQEFIVVKDHDTKTKLAEAAVAQDFVSQAPVVIVVCSNTDRVVKKYGERGVRFYSIIDGAFSSMLILLSVINKGLGACFVGAFEDDKVSKILQLPKHVRPIGIIPIGYPNEPAEKLCRIALEEVTYYEKYGQK